MITSVSSDKYVITHLCVVATRGSGSRNIADEDGRDVLTRGQLAVAGRQAEQRIC